MINEINSYTFMISGGGTGGHIFPAIAIGQALKSKFPTARIEFVGASDRMEMQKVPEAGFPIHGLWISGLQRKLTFSNLLFPLKVAVSVFRSIIILNKIKPKVVIGVGGFASGPLLFAANLRGIPTLIQEQNSYPGITNKILAGRVKKICVAFENMDRFFPKNKLVITGNPIRQDIINCKKSKAEARAHFGLDVEAPSILIIGGSLGARTINLVVAEGLAKLKEAGINILWQTGKFYADKHEVEGLQTIFIKEMDLAYASADVVISRAGASSLSEICALGKAAILVPSPNVAEDHQTKNATALVQSKAAEMVTDKDAASKLIDTSISLIKNKEALEKLESNALKLAKPQATENIIAEILKLVK
jgi:UDP-N-acetylglucosamine--N-acetylmuramyl-(pentapeptide) pyrophosphoryl-undecaprenol N-acetylglucosamine transferase